MYAEVFVAIEQSIVRLTYKWKIFLELYGQEDTVSLLNASGSSVFKLLQDLVIDDAILSISKLTDPASSGVGKDNASFEKLLEIAKGSLSDKTIIEGVAILARLKVTAKNLRESRSKGIAHTDLQLAINRRSLPNITYDELELAMHLCRELIMHVSPSDRYRSGFEVIIPFGHGPSKLLASLRKANGNAA